MDKFSYLSNADVSALEGMYQQYLDDPESVSQDWRRFFEGYELAQKHFPMLPGGSSPSGGNGKASPHTKANGLDTTLPGELAAADVQQVYKEVGVVNLINAYRTRGHLFATINPVLPRREYKPPITLEAFGLSEADLESSFQAGAEIGLGKAKLKDILAHLQQTYCGSIGVEYRFIRIPGVVQWLQERMEQSRNTPNYSPEVKKHILKKVGQSTTFEQYIHRKFVGQKRFSLEGAEALIPALDGIIESGAEQGVDEFVIGMAHRGRLNVLTNIMQKEYDNVFGEFQGKLLSDKVFDGDVKYHMGFSSDPELSFPGSGKKTVHLSLAPNPSHLEAVDPVIVGMARAKMDNLYGGDHDRICPIMIHGDASLSGQGVVYEVIQMSRLEGYQVGGSIHIVINNQIGFTTERHQGRTSTYCTDVGKVTLSPVFHVNGDDPEALVFVTKLAMEFRQEFNRDVFIDIVCYRKYGHNEGDEPRFTQPKMYEAISKHDDIFTIYSNKLLQEGSIDQAHLDKLKKELADNLDEEFEQSKEHQDDAELNTELQRMWDGITFYDDHEQEPNPDTAVKATDLKKIAKALGTIPEGFNPHRNIKKLLEMRSSMLAEGTIDWGMGELLAYGSLLLEGKPVRMTGQDCERGTFSHRHAVLVDQNSAEKYIQLNHLSDKQKALLHIHNSNLSEYGVMGFEYGYSCSAPGTLTIWEAQFGDFVNGAQIIIDQFISASKTKWLRMSGLVLLLPHGYEGQGPEHSSARMERFLTLGAENNMYVCDLTTPANLFHAMRRQLLTPYRKPLVIFSPKSLLRHPQCVSTLDDFAKGGFQEVIDDASAKPASVERVVFCTGKLYYDLLKARDEHKLKNVALVRIEQLYPWPGKQFEAIVKRYKNAKSLIWAQEEPQNMGAWSFILRMLYNTGSSARLDVVGRKESASPATGTKSQHESQQRYIIRKALDLPPDAEVK